MKCKLPWLPLDGKRQEGDWDTRDRCTREATHTIAKGPGKVCEKHAGQIAFLIGMAGELAESRLGGL